jgi:leucyl aminopeptidase
MAEPSIAVVPESPEACQTPLLVVQLFRGDRQTGGYTSALDERLGGMIGAVLERGDFRGRKDEALVLYPPDGAIGARRILLLGAGKREDFTIEVLRRTMGSAVRHAERIGVTELAFTFGHIDQLSEHMGDFFAARAAAEGAILASWQFREMKSAADEDDPPALIEKVVLVGGDRSERGELERGARIGAVAARAANFARSLAVRPGNVATPTFLARTAEQLAARHDLRVTVLDRDAIRAEGMHALLAVANGSEEEPRFIVLEYRGGADGAETLVLVGKGVTFDSGGISIKPADKMEDMKYDMAGAAAVLGALQGIAELQLPVNVVGLIPAAENLPSGRALKPGDVIGSHLGKTIEVVNTDAEGRLLLADALSFARRFQPAAVVDAATLTGAVIIALGHHAIGIMGNHGRLLDEVRAAGQRAGERCWPLPLWDEFREQLDSEIADIKNVGGRPASSITAGWFLKEFAGEVPWVHLDIAGTAYGDSPPPYLRKGPTGTPTRLLIEWVRSRAEA